MPCMHDLAQARREDMMAFMDQLPICILDRLSLVVRMHGREPVCQHKKLAGTFMDIMRMVGKMKDKDSCSQTGHLSQRDREGKCRRRCEETDCITTACCQHLVSL